tara:strand:+ start:674 stop:1675 length:1002 start_codon:yes stop_codon:yes gene_type:complete
MAVVRPLYLSAGNLRETSASQLSDQQNYGTTLFGNSSYRGVDLAYQASGNLTRMIDSRDLAGDLGDEEGVTNSTQFSDNSPDAVVDAGATDTFDVINQSTGTFSITGLNYPIYRAASGNLQIMSFQDMIDTYINQIVTNLVDGTDRGGLYSISTNPTTYANHTRISSNPVFVDKQFDKSIHGGVTSSNSEAERNQDILPLSNVDQPVINESYYLWRRDQETPGSFVLPLFWNGTALKVYSSAEWESFLGTILGYVTVNTSGHRIRYEIEGVGTDTQTISSSISKATMGTAMVDTTLNASVRINNQDGDIYRSANLPTGAAETETTYTLKIYRI